MLSVPMLNENVIEATPFALVPLCRISAQGSNAVE
jgi:hypothetical protein